MADVGDAARLSDWHRRVLRHGARRHAGLMMASADEIAGDQVELQEQNTSDERKDAAKCHVTSVA